MTQAIPGRVLAVLTGAVVVAHLVVLQNAPIALGDRETLGTRVFTTRTLQGAAPAAAQAPPAPAAEPPPRAVRPTPKVRAPEAAPMPVRPPDVPPPAPPAVPEPAVVQAEPPAAAASAAAVVPPTAPMPAVAAPTPPPTPATVAQTAPVQETPPAPAALAKDAALPVRVYAVPGSVRLKFNATGQNGRLNYQALGEMLWQHDGSKYEVRLELGAWGIGRRVISSTGRMTADGLAPTRFSDKFRSELAAHFDRERGRVVFSANTPEATLLPGAQDQLSVFVQLASMVAGEPAKYQPGTTVSMQTIGPRSADPWTFTVESLEKVSLPGDTLETLKLVLNPRKEYDRKVELWLAPALHYMPGRIRITFANGDFVDQQWRTTTTP